MASKKDNQLKTVDQQAEVTSSIVYAPEVVATIAGVAANEVEGIAGMSNVPNGKLGSKNKNVTKGVKVEVGPEEVSADLYVTIEYGRPIQKVAHEVQDGVRRSLEAMTGLHVVRVDVHVQGVSFEKENNALSAGAKNARLMDAPKKEKEPAAPKPKATRKKAEPAAEEAPQPKPEEKPVEETPAEPAEKTVEPAAEPAVEANPEAPAEQ